MFKIFGVGDDENMQELKDSIPKDGNSEECGQIALDVLETDTEIIIIAPIAGVDLSDIDLTLNKSVLTIKGSRQKPGMYYNVDSVIKNSECFWGDFSRNVILPDNLDFDSIKASMENNMLIVNITKLNFSSHSIKIDRIEG